MMDELFEIVKFRWGFQDEDDDGELVGGLEHEFIFPYIWNVIIPTNFHIFFRGVGIPPARSCLFSFYVKTWTKTSDI